MKKSIIIPLFCLASFTLINTACKKDKDPVVVEETPPVVVTPPTLYERVGGTAAVADPRHSGQTIETGRLTLRSVVDSAIYVIAGDTVMTKYFGVLLGEVGAGNTTGFAAL